MPRESEGFRLAVKAYSADLYRYAYWLCSNSHQAEDIVQDALIRAWKKWHSIEDVNATKSWLFTIVRREFLRSISKNERNKIENWSDAALNAIPDTTLKHEDETALRKMLLSVPVGMREPLILQVLGGFSSEEISKILKINTGAVQTRLTRARQG